jgi:hypothetical protein
LLQSSEPGFFSLLPMNNVSVVVCAEAAIDASTQQRRANNFVIACVDSYSKKQRLPTILFLSQLALTTDVGDQGATV